jgi:hypothetical protein
MKPCATASGPSRSPIVHLYVKTLGRIPPGGDHKMRGRVTARPGEERERRRGLCLHPLGASFDWQSMSEQYDSLYEDVSARANYRNTQ